MPARASDLPPAQQQTCDDSVITQLFIVYVLDICHGYHAQNQCLSVAAADRKDPPVHDLMTACWLVTMHTVACDCVLWLQVYARVLTSYRVKEGLLQLLQQKFLFSSHC